MNPTVKAVVARWNGDRVKAIQYCYEIIDAYPHLRAEYLSIVDALTGEKNDIQAHASVVETTRLQGITLPDSRLSEIGRSPSDDTGWRAAIAVA